MKPLLRSILAVLVGIVVCVVLIVGIEAIGYLLYPGIDPDNPETIPTGALLLVVTAYLVGTFCGAWLAAGLAGRAPMMHALVIGVLFLGASVPNLIRHRDVHPPWFVVACLGLFVPAALVGGRLAPSRPVSV